jgi:hypothetical protein
MWDSADSPLAKLRHGVALAVPKLADLLLSHHAGVRKVAIDVVKTLAKHGTLRVLKSRVILTKN